MLVNEEEKVSLWVVLAQIAGGLVVIGVLWAGYNYFKPAPAPLAVAGNNSDGVQWYSIHDGEEQFKSGQKCILYDFTAHWCHFCKLMDAQVFEDKTQAAYINQHFIPITVMDVAQEEGKNPAEVADLQSKYSVRGFPTLVILYPNGQSRKVVGFVGADKIVEFLQTQGNSI